MFYKALPVNSAIDQGTDPFKPLQTQNFNSSSRYQEGIPDQGQVLTIPTKVLFKEY